MNGLLLVAVAIGFVAGLRSMLAPALVAWAARLGWIDLKDTSVAWMGTTAAVVIFSLLALGELIADKRRGMQRRTTPFPLSARMVLGAFSAFCLAATIQRWQLAAVVLGGLGALAGAHAGYRTRRWLVKKLHTRDRTLAVAEDLIALGLAVFIVSHSVF